jgi:hypothetical protein
MKECAIILNLKHGGRILEHKSPIFEGKLSLWLWELLASGLDVPHTMKWLEGFFETDETLTDTQTEQAMDEITDILDDVAAQNNGEAILKHIHDSGIGQVKRMIANLYDVDALSVRLYGEGE